MSLTSTQIQDKVLAQLENLIQDGDFDDFDNSISLESQLIANLGFASVDFIQLFVAIEDDLQQKLGFHDLIVRDGKYVDDLSVAELVAFIDRKLNLEVTTPIQQSNSNQSKVLATEKINPTKVAQFRQTIPVPQNHQEVRTPKNKQAIFILCPPRSGSTLFRVVLAGHPQLFAPPELHLLTYNTLLDRKAALSNELNSHLLNGTIRAIMQIKNCTVQEAEFLMAQYQEQQMNIKEFYQVMQEWLPDKILVDKTPSYAYNVGILKRAEIEFENALYIHLVRHPYATIRSFEEAKLDLLVPFMQKSSFTRRELAEMIWLVSHQNILEFLQNVPGHRQMRIRFEDLVSYPQDTVTSICRFMGLEFHPDMLEPYKEKTERMTDGLEVVSQMSGDLKFYLHQGISADIAYRWKQFHTVDFLGDLTWDLAKLFGYGE